MFTVEITTTVSFLTQKFLPSYPVHTGGSFHIFPAFRVKPHSYAQTWAHAGAASQPVAWRLPSVPRPCGAATGTHLGAGSEPAGCLPPYHRGLPGIPRAAGIPAQGRAGQPGGERLVSTGVFPRRLGARCCLLSPGLRREPPPQCPHPRAAPRSAPPRRRPAPALSAPGAEAAPAHPPEDPSSRTPGEPFLPGGSRWDSGEETLPPAPQQARQKGKRCGKSRAATGAVVETGCWDLVVVGGRGGSDCQLAKSGLWEMETEPQLSHPAMC